MSWLKSPPLTEGTEVEEDLKGPVWCHVWKQSKGM